MNYREYLKTQHWKDLKISTLSRRIMCQNCSSKKKLLLHHKNYKCLFKEKDEDLIVMCFDCHHRKHESRNFKINGVNLNFTRAKNTETDFFKLSESSKVRRKCNRCGEEHGLVYRRFENGEMHIGIICPNSKPRTLYTKYIPGLDIPFLEDRKRKVV